MPVMKTFIESHEVDTNSRVIKRNFFFEYVLPIRLSQRANVPSFQCSSKFTSPGSKEQRERLTIRNQDINRYGDHCEIRNGVRVMPVTDPNWAKKTGRDSR
jgi:hypothetical protein